MPNVMQYAFFAVSAALAPLLSNLAFPSRALAFFAGPLVATLALLLSSLHSSEAMCWFPLAIPMMVLYTAPFWVLSWMITDNLRVKKPEETGEP